MFRENFFSRLISSAALVINPLIPFLLFCWRRVNEYCPFWLLHIHFPCELSHKPCNYFSDLSTNSSDCGNITQRDNFFPLAFVANEPPLLPCHSWGTSLFLLRTRSSGTYLHSNALPVGAYQALAHWALQAAEECQDCVWKASQWWLLSCNQDGDVGMGLPRAYICHHPSLLEPRAAAVGAVPLSHTGLDSSGTALQKVLASLVSAHHT